MINPHIGGHYCPVLPAEMRNIHFPNCSRPRAMRVLLQEIKEKFPSAILALDLPPIISGDDVLTMLPYVDCFLGGLRSEIQRYPTCASATDFFNPQRWFALS
jgi:hypothetical protein